MRLCATGRSPKDARLGSLTENLAAKQGGVCVYIQTTFKDNVSLRVQRILAAATVMLTFVINQYVCRIRDRHEPDASDADAFLSSGKESVRTRCVTCDCDLELRADPDSDDVYWIVEL